MKNTRALAEYKYTFELKFTSRNQGTVLSEDTLNP